MSDRTREGRIRRLARRFGYGIYKSTRKESKGKFLIYDLYGEAITHEGVTEFDLDALERFLRDEESRVMAIFEMWRKWANTPDSKPDPYYGEGKSW